jgi:hypothetical protein
MPSSATARRCAGHVVLLAAVAAAGCDGGFAPVGPAGATDAGFLGCQIAAAPGATVRDGDPLAVGEPMAGVPVTTLTPRQVGEAARARGLKVTWRYDVAPANDPAAGTSECWCEPPSGGRVTDVAYGMASELVVFVETLTTLPAPRSQPPRGWGCR